MATFLCWCFLCQGALAMGADSSARSFKIFNSIHYKNTPDLTSRGLFPLNLVYENRLLRESVTAPGDMVPDTEKVKKAAALFLADTNVPVTLDIEVWSFSRPHLDTTISRYLRVIDDFKKVNDRSPMGFYGVVPKVAFQWKNIDPATSRYQSWKALNERLRPVADKIDVFFPSFYTFDTDTTSWKKVVIETISEIRKYNPDKPVYGYIWPQYHDKTPLEFQFVDPAIWKFQLETLYELIDGVVIWTSNKDVNKQIITWDESMPWWKETLNFIDTHSISKP